MFTSTYDIFSGHVDKDAMWIGAVQGLGSAAMRMHQLAAEKPGTYFVFCTRTRQVLASIDTSKADRLEEKAPA
jgi:hypothetical protein